MKILLLIVSIVCSATIVFAQATTIHQPTPNRAKFIPGAEKDFRSLDKSGNIELAYLVTFDADGNATVNRTVKQPDGWSRYTYGIVSPKGIDGSHWHRGMGDTVNVYYVSTESGWNVYALYFASNAQPIQLAKSDTFKTWVGCDLNANGTQCDVLVIRDDLGTAYTTRTNNENDRNNADSQRTFGFASRDCRIHADDILPGHPDEPFLIVEAKSVKVVDK